MLPLALIGLAASAAGGIAGGIGSAVEMKKSRAINDELMAENKNIYNQQYYSDYTKRADVQSALGRMRDQMKRNVENRRNTASVMGSTPEVAVAEQKADNEALGEATSSIAGQSSAFKQDALNQYRNYNNYLKEKKALGYEKKAQQWGNLAGNAINLGTSVLTSQLK